MSDPLSQPKLVKALYNFKGSNNDELWFNKFDVITVTQMVEGGWWEGTYDGKTGWFPSNFVKEIKPDSRAGARSPTVTKPGELVLNKRESILTYHDVVLRSLKDTERSFVNDVHLLLQTYLRPLQSDTLLSKKEFHDLVGNLEDIASTHHSLLSSLDECAKLPVSQQRIGGICIKMAPKLQTQYHMYCANHPKAVYILLKKREELTAFMESKGAPSPGIETLTTSLSKPFTRLDKYSSMLKELERHTEESHPDRGDTQRAISVYRDIASSCAEIRKQKEMEHEIMGATIKGWEGEEISKLGEVLLLSHVRVTIENGEKKERLFLLFPGQLIMLSVSTRMSQYIYEGKLPVSGMTISSLEDLDNISFSFEITGSMIDRRVVACGRNSEKRQWMELLRQQAKLGPSHTPSKPQNLQISSSQPCITTISQPKTAQVIQPSIQKPTPLPVTKPVAPAPVTSVVGPFPEVHNSPWTMTCLRPAPPLRPLLVSREEVSRSPRSGRKLLGAVRRKPAERAMSEDDHSHHGRKNDPKTLEEDALILKVIEAYCTSARARHTVNSSILESPQVLIVEEEKIFVEENLAGQVIVEEKSLVDTVYFLKDQVEELKDDQQTLRKDLDEEKRARKKLETMLRKSIRSIVETTHYEDTVNANVPS